MKSAKYIWLDDKTVGGTIPACRGVIAFGQTKEECSLKLQSNLESWILVGLKLGHSLPIIHGINLNVEPQYEDYSM